MGGAGRLARFASALVVFCVGCVERSQEITSAEREQLRPHVSRQAPAPRHPLHVEFEDKVEVVGYDVDPATASPGSRVTVTWFWHVKRPLGEGWNLFTHLVDVNG